MPKGDLKYLEGGRKSSFDEIRASLRANEEKEKLEGMKHLVALMSMGKDVADLFPDVVMAIVCQSLELKKLVYMYLVRYAEVRQDQALLSINTFQKDLSDSNQLIRALALRVMSSIRVPMIAQLVLLAIKKAASDPSAYVRKTAAHALPKLYNMDQEMKDGLLEILQTLLADRLVMVLGSSLAAFNEICPNNFDLIHAHFRKLCHVIVDMDEWGQITLLNALTRYGRTQFLCPFHKEKEEKEEDNSKKKKKKKKEKDFYDSDSEEDDDEMPRYQMDPDHRLLLNCAKSLLQSRNSGVVMAVASLYFHLAPQDEWLKVIRPMVRILHGHREMQWVVLSNIASWCTVRPDLFKPFLTEFFIKATDGRPQRELKLEILVHIVDEESIRSVLKEFQTYAKHHDDQFVANTIQALGRCAGSMESVAESCLRYLMTLIRSRKEGVVSEAIVVIRRLLQIHPKFVKDGVDALARQLDSSTVPGAKASIAWCVGEFIHKIPHFGPDALRILLRNFADEPLEVKQQALTLGAKVFINNPSASKELVSYLFDMCRYDTNYDLRDRTRVLRTALFETGTKLYDMREIIVNTKKPEPKMTSIMGDRQRYYTASLSHLVNHTALGYIPLSDFPTRRPDPSVRDAPVDMPMVGSKGRKKKSKKQKEIDPNDNRGDLDRFYASESSEDESDEESDEESGDDDGSGGFYSNSDEDSDKDSDEDDDSDDDSEESDEEEDSDEDDSKEDSDESSSEEEEAESSSEEEAPPPPKKKDKSKKKPAPADDDFDLLGGAPIAPPTGTSSNKSAVPDPMDLLNDFVGGDMGGSSQGSAGLAMTPMLSGAGPASTLPKTELLNWVTSRGLGIEYQFVRQMTQTSAMNLIKLYLNNHSNNSITQIRISKPVDGHGMTMTPFSTVAQIAAKQETQTTISIDFNSKVQPAQFEITDSNGTHTVKLHAPVGELLVGDTMSLEEYTKLEAKLQGMHMSSGTLQNGGKPIAATITKFANVTEIPGAGEGKHRFAGRTLSGGKPVLMSLDEVPDSEGMVQYRIHIENAVLGSSLQAGVMKAFSE